MRFPAISFLIFICSVCVLEAQCISGDCVNGNGTYFYTNGDKYSGDWVDGRKEGNGRYDWADSSYYIGEFKNDFRDGKGNYVGADGVSLEGSFVKGEYVPTYGCVSGDCVNGKGTFNFNNGDKYAGYWVNGKRNGYGRYDWGIGGYYVGYFKDNKLHGDGAYHAANGTSKIGQFDNNNFIGEAPVEIKPKADSISYEDIIREINRKNEAEQKAKEEAIRTSAKKEFCSLAQVVVTAFPTKFESILGARQISYFDIGDAWYANVMAENSVDAGITETMMAASRAYYNVLFNGDDFEAAKSKYDFYVDLLKGCPISCCTQVYDTNNFKGENFESYMTYWLTFLVDEGFDESTYKNMVIEIELMSSVTGPKWSVVFRVYDLKGK